MHQGQYYKIRETEKDNHVKTIQAEMDYLIKTAQAEKESLMVTIEVKESLIKILQDEKDRLTKAIEAKDRLIKTIQDEKESFVKNTQDEENLRTIAAQENKNSQMVALYSESADSEREQMKKIHNYDMWLEEILDIRCSPFKLKVNRYQLQGELLDMVSRDWNSVATSSELRECFQHDHHFCGYDRKDNGKLRQLYVEIWKLRVERNKYKNIAEKLNQ